MAQHLKVLLLAHLWVLLLNCSSAPSDLTPNGSNNLDFTSIGSNVTTLNLAGSSATLKIENPTVDDDVVLILYGTQNSDVTSHLSLSLGAPQNELGQGFQSISHAIDNDENIAVDDLHLRLRSYEENLKSRHQTLGSGFQATRHGELTVGDTDSFMVMNSVENFDDYETVDATLLYQTAEFNFFVDNRSLDSMSETNIVELCENFSAVIDDMHNNFGQESDVNVDGRFDILATPVVNQLSESDDSMTTGFFFAKDLYDVEGSNQREIFYTAVPDPVGEYAFELSEEFAFSNILPSTLPHEFQHMINHNERVFMRNAAIEESWLNEALSHLAEDIYSLNHDGYMENSGIENAARVDLYLDDADGVCFVCDTSLAARGGAYLFLRSLYESAEQLEYSELNSGRDLIQSLVRSSHHGTDNVVRAVYGEDATDDDFQDLVGEFSLKVFFSTQDTIPSDLIVITGLDLYGYQHDNRHTNLNGVSYLSDTTTTWTSDVEGNSVVYIQISGEDLIANGGEISLQYADRSLAGFLIHTNAN